MLVNEQQLREYIENFLLETERRKELLKAIITKNKNIADQLDQDQHETITTRIPKGLPPEQRKAERIKLKNKANLLGLKIHTAGANRERAQLLLKTIKDPWKFEGGKGKFAKDALRQAAHNARATEIADPVHKNPTLLGVKSGAKLDFARRMGSFSRPVGWDFSSISGNTASKGLRRIRDYIQGGGKVNTAGYSRPSVKRDVIDNPSGYR